MGTKRNPGKYDCYANAEPDEPMFVLLGRDDRAPALVDSWADASEKRGTDPAKIAEARECAEAMRRWRAERPELRPADATTGVTLDVDLTIDGQTMAMGLRVADAGDEAETERALRRAFDTARDGAICALRTVRKQTPKPN